MIRFWPTVYTLACTDAGTARITLTDGQTDETEVTTGSRMRRPAHVDAGEARATVSQGICEL